MFRCHDFENTLDGHNYASLLILVFVSKYFVFISFIELQISVKLKSSSINISTFKFLVAIRKAQMFRGRSLLRTKTFSVMSVLLTYKLFDYFHKFCFCWSTILIKRNVYYGPVCIAKLNGTIIITNHTIVNVCILKMKFLTFLIHAFFLSNVTLKASEGNTKSTSR